MSDEPERDEADDPETTEHRRREELLDKVREANKQSLSRPR
ncbi:hypothetical protein [Streptomyces sp. NBC_00344]